MPDPTEVLSTAFGLTKKQRQLVYRVGWVIGVTLTLAFTLGAFEKVGLHPPYVYAGDLDSRIEQSKPIKNLSAKQDSMDLLLRQTIAQGKAAQIRDKLRVVCTARGAAQDAALNEKDRLQDEYKGIMGFNYTEPPCDQLR